MQFQRHLHAKTSNGPILHRCGLDPV